MRARLRAAARQPRAATGRRSSAAISARSRLARATSQRDQLAADEQDHRALDDVRAPPASSGELARELPRRRSERGEQQRREHDADGRVAAEQRDGDAGEADVEHGDVRGGDRVVTPSTWIAPARPAKAPQMAIEAIIERLHRDAAVARRLGVEPDRAHLVAERRAVEDHVVDDGAGEREEDADVDVLDDAPRCRGTAPEVLMLAGDAVADCVVRERPADAEEVLRRCRSRCS